MKVEKIRRKGFTVISNDVLNNTALSWKAKGLFAYLWSQSDLWDFYEVEVLKHSTDGRASLRAGLKELEEHGYLKRYRNRDDKGILRESKWILSEQPMFDFPKLDKPTLDYPTLDNRTLTNTNYNNTNNNNTDKNEAVVDTSLVNIVDQPEEESIDDGFGKIVEFYQENFGMMSSFLYDDMRHTYNEWQQQSNEPDLIIIKAMQIALSNNVRNWKYACAVLRTWEDKRPQSLSDVEALEAEHKNNRTAKSKHAKPEKQKTMENFDDLANKQNAGIDMSETLSDIESLKNQLYG
ncbi:DnaD domain protein [Ligilactobacillus ruminis]|uniref:DnaD domain protein n=1 Tax=Ligilactobacillus ruminis TaxID=1623 RepID=A0A8B2Z0Z9_9LACO|nr:DnaD domain protein [Ligilactobacillus ruminis]RGK46583.1 DnaD domain protein [Ligilactobacillus ruminis]